MLVCHLSKKITFLSLLFYLQFIFISIGILIIKRCPSPIEHLKLFNRLLSVVPESNYHLLILTHFEMFFLVGNKQMTARRHTFPLSRNQTGRLISHFLGGQEKMNRLNTPNILNKNPHLPFLSYKFFLSVPAKTVIHLHFT